MSSSSLGCGRSVPTPPSHASLFRRWARLQGLMGRNGVPQEAQCTLPKQDCKAAVSVSRSRENTFLVPAVTPDAPALVIPPPPPPLACGRLSVFGKHPGSSGPSTQIARIPRRYLRHVKVRRTSHNTSPLKGCRHTVLQDLAAPFRACACRLASLSHVFNARSCANDAALPSLVPSTVEHRYPVARASSYRPLRRIFHALVLFSFVSH